MRRLSMLVLLITACSLVSARSPDGVLDCDRITEWQLASLHAEGQGPESPREALINALSYQQADRGGSLYMVTDTTASLVVRGRELAIAEAMPHPGGGWFAMVTSECDR